MIRNKTISSVLESLGDTIAELSRRALEELPKKEIGRKFAVMLSNLEQMEDLAIRSFLSRRTSQAHGTYTELEAMEKEVLELTSSTAQTGGVSAKVMVDLLSLVERMSKTLRNIFDLALPTYVFQQ